MTQQLYNVEEIDRLYAVKRDLLAALHKIAAWDDERANAKFERFGQYSGFDEPVAVQIAREAIAKATPGDGGAQAYIDAAQPVNPYKGTQRPTYYECGCCDQLHSTSFFGDCREDANRFNPEDLDAKHGESRWEIVEMEE